MARRFKVLKSLVSDSLYTTTKGSAKYLIWMGFLTFVMIVGMFCYTVQLNEGLSATGMVLSSLVLHSVWVQ